MVPPFWIAKGWLQSRVHPISRAEGSSEMARPGLSTALLYVTAPSLCFVFWQHRLLTTAFHGELHLPSLVALTLSFTFVNILYYTVLSDLVSAYHLFPARKLTGTLIKLELSITHHSTWSLRGGYCVRCAHLV